MAGKVQPVPKGYHTATPYLIVKGADQAIEFYVQAFGAVELLRLADASGKVAHAEIRIGDSIIMLGEELPEMGYLGPDPAGGKTPVSLLLYVPDVDARFKQALAAGAKETRPVQDQF